MLSEEKNMVNVLEHKSLKFLIEIDCPFALGGVHKLREQDLGQFLHPPPPCTVSRDSNDLLI